MLIFPAPVELYICREKTPSIFANIYILASIYILLPECAILSFLSLGNSLGGRQEAP
jgi:hypothetical protein